MGKLKFRGTNIESAPNTLPYSPPIVTSATHHYLTPSTTSYSLLNYPGQNVIHLPDEPMTAGFVRIDGRNVCTDMVVIGGDIQPPKVYDSETLRLLASPSTWYIKSTHGFSGANGGQFRVRGGSSVTANASTALLDWDIGDDDLKDEINAALGAGACFAVENTVAPNHPGGPWNFVPGENALMGYATVVNVSLTAPVGQTVLLDSNHPTIAPPNNTPFTQFQARVNGFQVQQWINHCHVEGIKVYSEEMNDAFNVATRHATSILTVQNCYFRAGGRIWHNDWIHPDGMQMFLGPAKMFTHNVTSISIGAAIIAQPRNQMGAETPLGSNIYPNGLQALYDWKWSNVDGHSYLKNPIDTDPANVMSVFSQWGALHGDPGQSSYNDAGWTQHMDNVWLEAYDVETGLRNTTGADSDWYNYLRTWPAPNVFIYPDGLTVKATPGVEHGASPNGHFCDPDYDPTQAGLGYVSPGYTGDPLPFVQQRLDAETLVTPD
jgi:hypothetical protein